MRARIAWALALCASLTTACRHARPEIARPAPRADVASVAPARVPVPTTQPAAPAVLPSPAARVPAPPMSYLGADWLVRPEREAEEQPDRMLDALHLRAGMTVADVGAGVGYHAWRMATRVGPTGRVYATDIQPEMIAAMRAQLARRGARNVTPVLTAPDQTGLPDGAIDLVLMVDVFHEIADSAGYLRALRRALAPGGRVVLVEFRAEDPNVPIREEHKMTAAQAIAELGAQGYALVERLEFLPWQHILVFAPR